MKYTSTRDAKIKVSAAAAISQGISDEGGLFVPEFIPLLSAADFERISALDYIGRAKEVLKLYLTDFTEEELDYCVKGAYSGTFDNNNPAPLKKIDNGEYILELWHGPT